VVEAGSSVVGAQHAATRHGPISTKVGRAEAGDTCRSLVGRVGSSSVPAGALPPATASIKPTSILTRPCNRENQDPNSYARCLTHDPRHHRRIACILAVLAACAPWHVAVAELMHRANGQSERPAVAGRLRFTAVDDGNFRFRVVAAVTPQPLSVIDRRNDFDPRRSPFRAFGDALRPR
jgi:hypothetical protein